MKWTKLLLPTLLLMGIGASTIQPVLADRDDWREVHRFHHRYYNPWASDYYSSAYVPDYTNGWYNNGYVAPGYYVHRRAPLATRIERALNWY